VLREGELRSGEMAGRIARLALVDCVLTAVAPRTPHQTEAALRATFDAVRDLRMEGQPRR
jgi:DNA-binding MurR/RpiR family transcriptional regulator